MKRRTTKFLFVLSLCSLITHCVSGVAEFLNNSQISDVTVVPTKLPVASDIFEENDNSSSARLIEPGTYGNLDVVLSDQDYFLLDVTEGYNITIIINILTVGASIAFIMYAPTRALYNDGVVGERIRNFIASESGIYTFYFSTGNVTPVTYTFTISSELVPETEPSISFGLTMVYILLMAGITIVFYTLKKIQRI